MLVNRYWLYANSRLEPNSDKLKLIDVYLTGSKKMYSWTIDHMYKQKK